MAKSKKNSKSQVNDKEAQNLYTMIAPSQKEANSKSDETNVDTSKS